MKIIIGILLISCFLGRTTAQNANYKRAEETKAFSLPWKYDRLTPFFTEGSDDFWYSLQTNDGEKYFYVDLKNKKVEEFIDPVYLATEMEKAKGRKYNPKIRFMENPFQKRRENIIMARRQSHLQL